MAKVVKAVILDFDGVVLETISVKRDAFRELFRDYPQHVDRIVDYHMEQGGLSRFKKFEHIYANILHEPLSAEFSARLGERFAELLGESVIRAPYVKGAREFIEQYHCAYDLFIATGTPQEEIDWVIGKLDLAKYFRGVFGSPSSKSQIVARILHDHGLHAEDAIFVGDAINDLVGARDNHIAFAGRVHRSFINPFVGKTVDWLIDDLTQLAA